MKIACGTDAPAIPHGENAKELWAMCDRGMTPMQAIQSATSNAADLLGHASEVGSIKPGKYADLVAVIGDPLKDISILENIEFVMKEGKVYKQAGVAACQQ